jgi:hypothetical protein
MRVTLVQGDGPLQRPLAKALESSVSALMTDLERAIKHLEREEVFLVVGNKCTVHKRMVEAWTAWTQQRIQRGYFVCLSFKQAWYLAHRNKLHNATPSTGNRADVRDFLTITEASPWFDFPYDLLVLEQEEARRAFEQHYPR